MDYRGSSRTQLLERIEALEMLTHEQLKEKELETKLGHACTENLGLWYRNIKSNEVTYSPLKVTTLGYNKSKIRQNVPL